MIGASRADVLGWLARSATSLAGLHEAGLVHLDVKPANIVVGRDGRAQIVDLGLASHDRPDVLARRMSEPTIEDFLGWRSAGLAS